MTTKAMTVNQRKERARKVPIIIAILLGILYLALEGVDRHKKSIKIIMLPLLGICLLMTIVKFLPFAERLPADCTPKPVLQEQVQETPVTIPTTNAVVKTNTKEATQTTVMENLQPMVVAEETEVGVEVEETVVSAEEPQSNTVFFSEEDEFLIKSVAYAEAGIDGKEAEKAVMHVLYNRTKAEGFGSSIYEVVNQLGAFSSVKGGYVYLVTKDGNFLVTQDILPTHVDEAYETFVAEVQAGIDPTKELLRDQAYLQGLDDPKFWQNGALYFYNVSAISLSEQNARAGIRVQIPIGTQYFYCYWG